jgi:hypothetical protein
LVKIGCAQTRNPSDARPCAKRSKPAAGYAASEKMFPGDLL